MKKDTPQKVAHKPKKTLVAKLYRLKKDSAPLTYMLASNNSKRSPLLYFDEEKGINRPLRYARNQNSPFEDDQDGTAILEPIIFEDGFLQVPRENQVLQEFLYYHPSRGQVFEEVDKSRDAAEELEYEEAVLDAQVLARELPLEKLISVSRVLIGGRAEKLSTAELKRDVLVYSRNNPVEFLEVLHDPMLEMQDTVVQFFSNNLLGLKNKQRDVYFSLPKNKKKLLTVPFGEDHIDIVSSYMQSDDGIETFKLLNKYLKKDKKD